MNKILQKDISGSPVLQQIGKQGSLTEQYFVFANNAKQQITKPQILKNQPQSMVWDSAYNIGNVALDYKTWVLGYGGIDFINGAVSPNPPETGLQGIGFGVKEFIIKPLLEGATNE